MNTRFIGKVLAAAAAGALLGGLTVLPIVLAAVMGAWLTWIEPINYNSSKGLKAVALLNAVAIVALAVLTLTIMPGLIIVLNAFIAAFVGIIVFEVIAKAFGR
jgi:hypothetical protein